jgi:hypothetical protein
MRRFPGGIRIALLVAMRTDEHGGSRRCGVSSLCLLSWCGCATQDADGRPWVRDVRFEGVKSVAVEDLAKRLGVERSRWFGLGTGDGTPVI